MPLKKCPACEKEVSDQAVACPHCGHPLGEPKQPVRVRVTNQPIGCLGILVIAGFVVWFLNQIPAQQPTTEGLPESENQFCSIINTATSTYNSLSEQKDAAHSQRNGILEDRLTRQMTAVSQSRNADAFQAVQQANFRFDNWVVSVLRVSSPMEHWSGYLAAAIPFDVRPVCSTILKIHAATAATQENTTLLSEKREGDQVVISGVFLQQFSGPASATSPPLPTSEEEFEGSFTESGSMSEPEFSVLVMTVADPK